MYNTTLIDLAVAYNKGKRNIELKKEQLQLNSNYSEEYKRSMVSEMEVEHHNSYVNQLESLIEKIRKEKTLAIKTQKFSKFPTLKNDPAAFETAFLNATNFIKDADNISVVNEAEEALSMGRNDFALLLLDEMEKRNTGTKSADPGFISLLAKARALRENYFNANNIKYNELGKDVENLAGYEFDAVSLLNDIQSGFATIYPYRLYDAADEIIKKAMLENLGNMKDLTKQVLYSRAKESGKPQSIPQAV